MLLDVKSLIFNALLSSLLINSVLLFYYRFFKTYHGFKVWIFSTGLMSIGYFAFLLRPISAIWISALIGNLCFIAANILRYEGLHRFAHFRRAPSWAYWTLPLWATSCIYFLWFYESERIRTIILMALLCIPMGLTAALSLEIFRKTKSSIYAGISILMSASLLACLSRAAVWIAKDGLTYDAPHAAISSFFIVITFVDLLISISFILLNNKRVEQELTDIKGLIPICSYCKSIRDNKGDWQALETYLAKNSAMDLTHGICPHCAEKLRASLKNQVPG